MDTLFSTVALDCACGASLRQVDFAHRTGAAEEEFRAQHRTELCRVAVGRCCPHHDKDCASDYPCCARCPEQP